jgi:hypothetical protein
VTDLLIVIEDWGQGGRSSNPESPNAPEPETPLDPVIAAESEENDVFINDGVLAPAEEGGLVRVDSDFLQTENGVLSVELVNTEPIHGHDVVMVNGIATVGGGLAVNFGDGFVPRIGDRYGILIAIEIQAEFTWMDLPIPGHEMRLVVCQQPGAIVLEVHSRHQRHRNLSPVFPRADLNHDGVINSLDLLLIMEAWSRGGFYDLNGDGRFTPRDLMLIMEQTNDCW